MRYALIGEKLTHSLSKPLHMHFFDIIGEKSSYDLIEIKKDEFEKTTTMKIKRYAEIKKNN